MRRTMRVLATLSILASSLFFAQSSSAIGTLYSAQTGSGDVACTTSGWFSISNNSISSSNNCRGTAEIPLGVTSIGYRAFYTAGLSAVTIPSTVTSIGAQAFVRSGLTSITIPDSVTSIGEKAFFTTELLTSVILGNGITAIPAAAFQHAHGLTSVTISNSVLSIGSGAFWSATALTSITIPDSVTLIGISAFQGMLALESIVIGNRVTTIDNLAFSNLPKLTNLVIGNSVRNIGTYTFAGPNLLTSVNLPSSLTTLGVNSFSEKENSSSANANLLSYRFCGTGVSESALASAGLGSKTRLACPAVITPGSEPNSQIVTFPAGVTVAEIPGSSSLPSIKLTFAATAPAAVTVVPTTNPASEFATPFMTSGSPRIVDIRIPNHNGSDVTVCLEGATTDRLYHYTAEEWVELRERSYANGQVCGVTNSFSPFTAAPAKPVITPAPAAEAASAIAATATAASEAVAPAAEAASNIVATATATATAAAEASAAKREVEKRDARAEIVSRFKEFQALTVENFQRAEIAGITSSNIKEFSKEILRLPIEQRSDIAEISKLARKYEVVGLLGSDRVKSVYPSQYIEVGLIPADSKIKSTLAKAVSGLTENERSSYEAIKAAIVAKTAEIQARKDRLAKVLARPLAQNGK